MKYIDLCSELLCHEKAAFRYTYPGTQSRFLLCQKHGEELRAKVEAEGLDASEINLERLP